MTGLVGLLEELKPYQCLLILVEAYYHEQLQELRVMHEPVLLGCFVQIVVKMLQEVGWQSRL